MTALSSRRHETPTPILSSVYVGFCTLAADVNLIHSNIKNVKVTYSVSELVYLLRFSG